MTNPQHAAGDHSYDDYATFYQNSAYAKFRQEHRAAGAFGLTMMEVQQDAFDLVDPPVPQLVFIHVPTLQGRAFVDLGDGVHAVQDPEANMLQITPAGVESHCGVDRPHKIIAAALPVNAIERLLEGHDFGEDAFSRYYAPGTSAPRATALMDTMWRFSSVPGPTASLYLDGAMMQFLAIVADHHGMSPCAPDRPEDLRIARAIEYIEAHLAEDLTVGELATIAALSPSQFARVFKATTGEAVWSWVQRRRLERARELLLTSRKTIAQITYDCGFSGQAHFTRAFRQAFGTTPGSLRR